MIPSSVDPHFVSRARFPGSCYKYLEAQQGQREATRYRDLHLSSDCSSTEPNAAFKLLESPVGAKRIEAWSEQDAWVKSLFVTFFKPAHSLIRISERSIDYGNLRGI